MPNIVVTNNQDLTDEQTSRLNSLGDVTYYDDLPSDGNEYLRRVANADIICSGTAGLQDAYRELCNVYVTVAFVSVAFVDLPLMRQNNVLVSNAPGANQHAVAEWVMAMATLLSRNLHDTINRQETFRINGGLPPIMPGLAGRTMTILGKGNVGRRVGLLANAFDMHVQYYTRDDDLHAAVTHADIVVDTLSSNPSTYGLLDDDFFRACKQGSHFISVTREEITETDVLIRAIDTGHIANAASDCGGILVGDTDDPLYQRLLHHPQILVTPHVAYSTEQSRQMGADIMIDNVAAWIAGTPINVLN